jgi:lipopolysaccharide biosynthesis glycosyltransferase
MTQKIEIVCGIDKNYAPHLTVMLQSIVASNPENGFRVHVLHDNVPPLLRDKVDRSSPSVEIIWHQVTDHAVLGFTEIGHITRATYLRLMMLEALDPSLSRVLYLDVDMIVNGDLAPLWNLDLQGKVCAVVVDPGADADAFAQKWKLNGPGPYFNAGVMLYDLDKLRARPYLQQAIDVLANPDNVCEYGDQDALNIVLWNDCLYIDPKWNFQRKFLYSNYAAWNALNPSEGAPAIIHFTETEKPWRRSEWHPCRWLYLKSLIRTSFCRQVYGQGKMTPWTLAKAFLAWHLKRPPMFKAAG